MQSEYRVEAFPPPFRHDDTQEEDVRGPLRGLAVGVMSMSLRLSRPRPCQLRRSKGL